MLSNPDIHGDKIVFRAEGDIWIGSIKEKSARRITTDSNLETNPKFSPDGQWIAFSAGYEGGRDVYVMPSSGGAPHRLTYDGTIAIVLGWTPDGKKILFRSPRGTVNFKDQIYTIPKSGGPAELLPLPTGEFGGFSPKGRFAYVPLSFEWANWFRYQGGSTDQIWLADLKGGFTKWVSSQSVNTQPTWCGETLYYISENSGSANLWRKDPNGREQKVTEFKDSLVRYPSSDGKRVIFEHGPGLALLTRPQAKPKTLS